MTHLNGTQKYWYDANGNVTKRIFGSDTYDLSYNAEGKMVSVKKNSVDFATFVYDGDGNRVKGTINGTTISYVGNYADWSGNSLTKYYYAGALRIAMRQGSEVIFLLGDHLGSTSKTYRASDGDTKRQLYKPWGERRYPASSELPTTWRFTGQRHESDIALYFFNARWYDNSVGRFMQADTDVPESQGNPQGIDRYAFVINNPIKYTDPGGHCWGVASAIRGIPSYDTTCNNLDMALEIVNNPNANVGQKALVVGYIAAEAAAHTSLVVGASGLVCGLIGSCAAAVEAALGIGSAKAIDLSSMIGENVWGMNPLDRGWAIEDAFGRSPELTSNFPTIDRYSNGLITSIKSVDLGAKTYQNLGALTRTVQGYITELVKFNGATYGGFRLTSDMISGRQLILALPPNATAEQLKLLQELQEWAMNQGVVLFLQEVK